MNDILSQIKRSQVLHSELKVAYKKDLASKNISAETKNLVQEVLSKVRSYLDHTVYKIFSSFYFNKKLEHKVKYPLVNSEIDLNKALEKMGMGSIDKDRPELYGLIASFQSYHSKYRWLNDFKDYSNIYKHRKFTPQKQKKFKTIFSESQRGLVSFRDTVKCGEGVQVLGHYINPPGIKVEVWIGFIFEGTNINVLRLCELSVKEGEQIVNKMLSFIESRDRC